jgi:chaperone required for assembly of F1-ATPase
MIYPYWHELAIRFLDGVLVLVIVAGHIKVLWDGRTQTSPGRRTITIDGRQIPFQEAIQEPRHNS